MSRIGTKSEQRTNVTHCFTDICSHKNRLEIIYIILSNKLRNYRNRETCPKFLRNLGAVSPLFATQ